METITITTDSHGRTVVAPVAPQGHSRRAIISRNDDAFYMVPTVNHGETVVRGGRSFSTLKGAIKAAQKFILSVTSGTGRQL
jgi:hypothetical protein